MVTKETKACAEPENTALPVNPFNEEVQKKCIGDAEVITCRPADLLEPELPKLEASSEVQTAG